MSKLSHFDAAGSPRMVDVSGKQTSKRTARAHAFVANKFVRLSTVTAVSHQALTKLDLDIVKLVISKPFDVDEFTKAVYNLCCES